MTPAFDLAGLLADAPRNCWLALNKEQTQLVGRGETLKEAAEEAAKAGIEEPVLLWAPQVWRADVY